MQLYPIETGYFKLDGGAMFGVVPKSIWSRSNPADQNNLCTWAMRSLLIEDGERLILIDTGIGNKQSDRFFSFLHLHGEDNLDHSLHKKGFHPDDVTDVILTHLHFDHVGGAVVQNAAGQYSPKFKNAKYWSNAQHWDWAIHPNPREKASFLSENLLPIEESGQLNFIQKGNELGPNISFLMVNGHTEAQMIPHIRYRGKTIVFVADLLPSTTHIAIPYVPSFDVRPLLTMEEKEHFFNKAINEEYVLFFQHDPKHVCCTIQQGEHRPKLWETFHLNEI